MSRQKRHNGAGYLRHANLFSDRLLACRADARRCGY